MQRSVSFKRKSCSSNAPSLYRETSLGPEEKAILRDKIRQSGNTLTNLVLHHQHLKFHTAITIFLPPKSEPLVKLKTSYVPIWRDFAQRKNPRSPLLQGGNYG